MQCKTIQEVLTKRKIDTVLEAIKASPLLKRKFQSAKTRQVGQGVTYRQTGKPMKTSQYTAARDKRITAAKAGDTKAQGELKRGTFTSTGSMGDATAGQTRQARLNRVVSGRKKQQMVAKAKSVGVGAAKAAGRMAADYAQEAGRRRRERRNTNYTGQPIGQQVAQSAADKAYDSLRSAMGGDKKRPEEIDRSSIGSAKTRREGTENNWRNSLVEAVETGKIEREKMMSGEEPPAQKKKQEHSVIDAITGINRE